MLYGNVYCLDRVGKGEFHPQTSHGTVRDSLPSYGSSVNTLLGRILPFSQLFYLAVY